ncbi:hypothetical protein BC937DRAFT_90374 [Endogone sp. FLAS-F59071]|nr:hypothetical protein BC937DRAFT_90374 [Endogone sp. FLAS-F59071]|eukprot:RUS17137.1 hypothetical protein BC937DRAFT_90374 [Endogone sp. FLAS-F59071]
MPSLIGKPRSIMNDQTPGQEPVNDFMDELVSMFSHSTDPKILPLVQYIATPGLFPFNKEELEVFEKENQITKARQWLANGN